MKRLTEFDWIQKIELFTFCIFICCYGLFYEGFAGIAGCILLALLYFRVRQCQELRLPKSLFLSALLLIPAAALITVFYAVDSGMAVLGAVKFFSVSVFILLISFEDRVLKDKLLMSASFTAVGITIVGILSWVTPLKDFFFIQDRFSGTFQYANSFAVLLLAAIIILLSSELKWWIKVGCAAVLIVGLILTGSRAVFVLMLASLPVLYVMYFGRKNLKGIAGTAAIIVAILVLAVIMVGEGRITRFDFTSSSFMARVLYNLDGLRMLAEHPLGLGYKGFLFYQGSAQTGNYMATYAHNELLQAALDFGVIMGILLAAGFGSAVVKSCRSGRNRLLFLVFGTHALFDWDFQFVVLLMIVVLLLDWDVKAIFLKDASMHKAGLCAAAALCSAGIIWLSAASVFEYANQYDTASKIYPALTTSQMRRINTVSDNEEKYEIAQSICERNEYCTIALQAMAEKSAMEGRFDEMEKYARQAVTAGRYNTEGYMFYLSLNKYVVDGFRGVGNIAESNKYLSYAAGVYSLIQKVEAETSPLADYLYHKPEIRLDQEYIEYMKQAKALTER